MGELVIHIVAFALGITLPHWIIRADERRLSGIMLARCWNTASHWSAVFGFSWLAVPVHFMRTRRSLFGLILAAGWLGTGLLVSILLLEGIALLFGSFS